MVRILACLLGVASLLVLLSACEQSAPPGSLPGSGVEDTPVEAGPNRGISLDDAPYYLDASAVLPGFRQVDERIIHEDLGFGSGQTVFVAYRSDEPLEIVELNMRVVSGDVENSAVRALLRDEETLEEGLMDGVLETAKSVGLEVDSVAIQWTDVAVGDAAKMAQIAIEDVYAEIACEYLIFIQEEEGNGVLVSVSTLWYGAEPPSVGALAVAREISDRLADR